MSLADVWQNPILLRTQRQSARVRRTPWIILAILVVVTLLVAAIGGVAAETGDPAQVGTGIFGTFFSVASFCVMMVGAFLAGHGLSSEHQGRTWEMLLLTGMTPRRIVTGKFFSALANVLFYLVALSPISAVAFVFGGVSAIEVLFAFGFLTCLGVLSVAFGLAVGSAAPQHGAVWAVAMMFLLFAPAAPLIGVGGTVLVKLMWSPLQVDSFVWWPAIAARSPIDLRYLLFVWLLPIGAFVLPSWLGVELAVAHVSEPGADRFYSFKRALLITTGVVCALCVASVLSGSDADQVYPGLVLSFVLHIVLALAIFALAGDDVYAYRRARHDLSAAKPLRRLLGPSVLRGTAVFLVAWILSFTLVSAVGLFQLVRFFAPSTRPSILLASGMTGIPFVMLCASLLAYFRAARQRPLVARILVTVIGLALSGVPWVLYAIVGGISHDREWLALGAPSPIYLGAMIQAIESTSTTTTSNEFVLTAGMIVAVVYVTLGVALFWIAARRSQLALDAELTYQHDVDQRLAAEDLAPPTEAT